jgi:putative transposase
VCAYASPAFSTRRLRGTLTLYQQARQANPKRWSGKTRDWSPVGAVTLNPERESVTAAIDNPTAEISEVAA